MAHVGTISDVSTRIDDYLEYLLTVMDDLPEIANDWNTWGDIEQLDFVFEWDIKRDRLFQLEQWNAKELLTVAQAQRYHQLLELLERRRPIIDRLLAD